MPRDPSKGVELYDGSRIGAATRLIRDDGSEGASLRLADALVDELQAVGLLQVDKIALLSDFV